MPGGNHGGMSGGGGHGNPGMGGGGGGPGGGRPPVGPGGPGGSGHFPGRPGGGFNGGGGLYPGGFNNLWYPGNTFNVVYNPYQSPFYPYSFNYPFPSNFAYGVGVQVTDPQGSLWQVTAVLGSQVVWVLVRAGPGVTITPGTSVTTSGYVP